MVKNTNKVFNFHDVYDSKWLENTLQLLQKKYKIVTIQQIEEYFYKNKNLTNTCLITVDDGDKTFYDVIFPVLKKLNIPAVLFVSPQAIIENENFWFQVARTLDKTKFNQYLSEVFNQDLSSYSNFSILKNLEIEKIWKLINSFSKKENIKLDQSFIINIAQLKEIQDHGLVTIGAHTQTHPILANETDQKSQNEIKNSITELEEILGKKIKYFAYPNGVENLDFTEREMRYLEDQGITLAFTTEPKDYNSKSKPLAIPRYGISTGNENFIKLKLLLGKYWEPIKSLKTKPESALRKELKGKLDQ